MGSHIVLDGNAFYEIDDECLQEMEQRRETKKNMEKGSRKDKEKKKKERGE